ncbi:hypothetical protein OIU84_008146 [Salix udensis]|uniref:Uncharacterized protein n=1 Tax=Salix udensis TaxID=889485 RepID=A0AAD6JUE3_9ROSI|nr:hypothetical protein OIU84_008146 [Salix udensis]
MTPVSSGETLGRGVTRNVAKISISLVSYSRV